ncbi:MAG: sugar ABC transporter permease [Anaerolineales bacterium]|nr:sugar ABC transporter permease [Chloroflexota bacterium]MBL6982537.1 sugar ABC transporter permease [Anaerolineales bacterium]
MERRLVSSRRIREWREYLTAYLMIAPSTILIFTFGIFPVGFALFVSLHKWRLKRGGFLGMDNFVRALDNLSYILFFLLAVGLLVLGINAIRKMYQQASENDDRPWWLAFPALVFSATILALIYWVFKLLPELLDIADKIIGKEKSRELFVQLLGEAFRADLAFATWGIFTKLVLASIVVGVILFFAKAFQNTRNFGYLLNFVFIELMLLIGGWLIFVTYVAVQDAYRVAFEAGADPGIWPQVITIGSGVILIIISWRFWQSAIQQSSDRAFIFYILGALTLLVGGALLITELPTAMAAGDEDIWTGLKVTAFYSLGTVPFQLTFSLFLAILLFQRLAGSEMFRMLYFLPYVTPTVASAAIFRQLFSNRYQAPINQLLISLGFEPLQWVREPSGIFTMVAESLNFNLPEWAAGPSLALVVIMIYSIWTFVGYNTVIYLAGLGNISTELMEAAKIDGAGRWAIFRHITLPLLSPTTYFLSMLSIIGTFKAFNHIWVMRGGGGGAGSALGTTDTFSIVIFTEFFEKLRFGYASAMAFVLFAVILSLTFVNNKIQGSRVFYG